MIYLFYNTHTYRKIKQNSMSNVKKKYLFIHLLRLNAWFINLQYFTTFRATIYLITCIFIFYRVVKVWCH